MSVTMIVPPIVETQLTGFRIAFEHQWRGKTQRVEVWAHAPTVRCSMAGKPVAWGQLGAKLRRAVHKWNDSQKELAK